jgi:hypothetical protein
MKFEDVLLPAALTLGAIYLVKTYLVDPAGAAGKWVGQNVITPAYYGAQYPGAAAWAITHGWDLPVVPTTPMNYLPSNWTWKLPVQDPGWGPTMLGLPAGMTPAAFCAGSPGSPICGAI